MDHRTCQRCGETKPIEAFPRVRVRESRAGTCKGCMPQYAANASRSVKHQWAYDQPARRAAHKAVEYALKRGDLTPQPCERCGDAVGVHAHHDDYSQPLAVMWLCPKHHRERHRELRAAAKKDAA